MTQLEKLENIASEARYLIIKTLIGSGMGHPGGSLSAIEILTSLYFDIMKIDSENPNWDERDRFIMSKGHACLGLSTILFLKGFISKHELESFRKNGGSLSAHVDMKKMPGVDMSTGSLGHGLSVGVGRALSGKINNEDFRVFVIMGDGETQEGSIWEAAMSAQHYKLDNLVGIIDRNKIQQCGFTEDIMSLEPYENKWESFGWAVKTVDGHSIDEIKAALKQLPFVSGKPSLLICDTVKGKGVSFMENDNAWHGGGAIKSYANEALAEVEFSRNKE